MRPPDAGGHTAEMLRLVEDLPTTRYSPRLYIVSSGDSTSVDKVRRLERCAQLGSVGPFSERPLED